MIEINRLITLVKEAFDEFSNPNFRTSNVVRKAIRIARLRNDYVNLFWLETEMVSSDNTFAISRIRDEVRSHCSEEKLIEALIEGYAKNRKIREIDENGNLVNKGNICVLSLPDIEERIDSFIIDSEKITPTTKESPSFPDYFKAGTTLRALAGDYKAILKHIEYRVHEFLSITEKQLLYEQINSDIFEKYRQYVDLKLHAIAPEALGQFTAAYKRLSEGDNEARSHALLSCRRILKTVADKLYPAVEEPVVCFDGKERKLTDDKYISRLWQYVADRAKESSSGDLLLTQITDLGNRIDCIYNLTNKGTHAEVSEVEVDQCIIQTYLLIGDILRLADTVIV